MEKAAKSTLVAQIKKLRWCFWHANVRKAESRMREIRLYRNKAACYAANDKTNDVIDEADHEPSCSARA
jgi:hypothetical protein